MQLWICHILLLLAVSFEWWILSILLWTTYIQNLQICAIWSFFLLVILLGSEQGRGGAGPIFSSDTNRTLCCPGAAQTPWPDLDKSSPPLLCSQQEIWDKHVKYEGGHHMMLRYGKLDGGIVIENWLCSFPGPPEGSIIWNCPPPTQGPVQAVLIIWSLTSRPGLAWPGLGGPC